MNFSPLLRVQGEHINHINADNVLAPTPEATINRLLRLVATDTSLGLASEFHKVWVIKEFALGDELVNYFSDGTNTSTFEGAGDRFSLVCQGRVRLLGNDSQSARSVSVQLLDVGESFGADRLFCASPISYRAVAASVGIVASLSIADLKIWLERAVNFESYLQETIETRQKLIFWKTCTQLRSSTSQILQHLSPYFTLRTVNALSLLKEATPASSGRYWLMHGSISNKDSSQQISQIGHSWGYPDVTSPAFTAETELLICHLPIENWELAKPFLPVLEYTKQESSGIPAQGSSIPRVEIPDDIPVSPQVETDNISISIAPEIEFASAPRRSRKYPFIGQQSSSDCGAACLAMICRYWGKRVSLNTLRRSSHTTRIGTELGALADVSLSLGYQAVPVRANLSAMNGRHYPWIAHWQGNHYVVVWRVRPNCVEISDPAVGVRKLPIPEFEANWTGYALILEPTERLQLLVDEKISLRGLCSSLLQYQHLVLQIVIASIVMQIFGLALPLIAQVVIDKVIPARMSITLNVFALGFMVLGIWRLTIKAARQYLLDYFSNHMDMSLMSGFIRHVQELPLQFFALRQVGDIMSRAEENHKIQTFLTRRAVGITLDALCAFLCLGLLAYYNLQLTLLVLGLTIPAALFAMGANPSLQSLSREAASYTAAQNNALREMITAITTIKSFSVERWVRWRWEERFVNAIKTRLRFQKLTLNLQLVNNLINHISSTAVFWCAASLMMQDQLSLGEFIAFNMLAGSIINPVLALVELKNDFQGIVVSIERLNDILLSKDETSCHSLEVMPEIQGEVCFDNVSFHHQESEGNVLQNISFSIKPGQTVGIVGTSGAGKSTLLNLLIGLYKPSNGRVLIDGHDIAMVLPQTLRTQLGIVPSEIFVFSGTILENITLFNPEFKKEDATRAAILAGAHDFIESLPQGYNQIVGAGATTLSIKQRYLLAIARALIRKPRILILDELASALDAQTEKQVKQNLSHGAFGCTTFIVTRRLDTLCTTDRVLVLDRGIIVVQGRHHELIANNKLYSRLVLQHA